MHPLRWTSYDTPLYGVLPCKGVTRTSNDTSKPDTGIKTGWRQNNA